MGAVTKLLADLQDQMVDATLTLSGRLVDSPSIQQLFADQVPGEELTLSKCTLSEETDCVRGSGEADAYGMKSVHVDVEFVPTGDTVELTVTIRLGDGARLSDWAPEVEGSLLEGLEFRNADLLLCSRGGGACGAEPGLRSGRNLRANLTLPDFMRPVGWLLGEPSELQLAGALPSGRAGASLDLRSAPATGVKLGFHDLEVSVRIVSVAGPATEPGGSPTQMPAVLLVSAVELAGKAPRTLQMSLQIPVTEPFTEPGLLLFEVDAGGVAVADLGALSSLVNTKLALPGIPLAEELQLTRLGFVVDPAQQTLVAASAVVASSRPAPLIKGVVEMTSVEVEFLVLDPTAERSVSLSITGDFNLGGEIRLEGYLQFPELTLSAGLAPGTIISLATLLRHFGVGAKLPKFDLVALNAWAVPRQRQFALDAALHGNWTLWGREGSGPVLTSLVLGLNSADQDVSCYLRGELALGEETRLMLECDVAESVTLKGTLTGAHLGKLVRDLASTFKVTLPALPAELPDFEFKEISVEFTPADQSFSFHAETAGRWEFPIAGVTLSHASFALSRKMVNGKATYPFSIALKAEGPSPSAAWPQGITVRSLDLAFSHDATVWKADGTLEVDLFEAKGITLTGGYTQDGPKSVLTLEKKGVGVNLLQFSGVNAALRLIDISFTLKHDGNSDGQEAKTVFDCGGKAQLTVANKLDVTGTLGVGTDKGIELAFDAAKPLKIPLPPGLGPSGGPSVALTNAKIGVHPGGACGGAAKGWYLDGGLSVRFREFPKRLQEALPHDPVTATLRLDTQSFSVTVNQVLNERTIQLPEIPLSHVRLDPFKVNAKNLKVGIDLKGDVNFSFDPVLTLPDGLNGAVFGRTGENGKGPEREILVTGQELHSELKIGLIDKSLGLGFTLKDSPLKAFPFENGYLPLDFGNAGRIKIEVPKFSGGTNGFAASGGFSEDPQHPLALPLTIVKNLLGPEFPELAKVIPDTIPLLKRPNLLKGDEKLDVGKLKDFLDETFHVQLPEELCNALQHLADAVTGLPVRLREYLFGDLPSDFHFSVNADPTGSVVVDIRTHTPTKDGTTLTLAQELDPQQGGRPIMVLFPALPMLVGLRLSDLQVGPIFGGSLILLRANAEIDIFDPVVLALAASIGATKNEDLKKKLKKWMPDATDAHTTFQVHDLVMFIVYETGIPIPVPIFYEKLGVDLTNPGGLALAASVSFNPLTHNGLAEVFGTLSQLYSFVTNKDARIDPNKGIQLDAKIGETYFKLPKFLGAGEVGSENAPLLDVDFSKIFANFLNGLKFFRLADVLAGIPLEYRCAAANPTFGPIALKGAWAATTRAEFTSGLKWSNPKKAPINSLVRLSREERKEIITVLDAAPRTGGEEGLVLLLAGEGKLGPLLTIGGRFGMVTAGRSGFATGVQLYGDLLNKTLAFKIEGYVHFDLTKPLGEGTAGFTGHAVLLVKDKRTAEALVTISDEEISFSVGVDLFPGSKQIALKEELKVKLSANGFEGSSSGELKLFNTSLTGEIELTDKAFVLRTSLAVGTAIFQLNVEAGKLGDETAIHLSGGVDNFSPGLMIQAAKEIRDEMNRQFREWVKWADAGYKKDQKKWWWAREKTLVNWEVQYKAYQALVKLTDGTGAKVAMSAVGGAINLLPTPLASGVRAMINQVDLFKEVSVEIDTTFSTALQGKVALSISGTYAGTSFAEKRVEVLLDAKNPKNLVADVAKTLARVILR